MITGSETTIMADTPTSLTRNQKLKLLSEETDRLEKAIIEGRRELADLVREIAEIRFLERFRGALTDVQRAKIAEDEKLIAKLRKDLAEHMAGVERIDRYAQEHLKTTLSSRY